jgi:hypothetical protein
MKINMGYTDRMIRMILACIFFMLWFEDIGLKTVWSNIFIVQSGILGITSLIGFCPFYTVFHISTNRKNKSAK